MRNLILVVVMCVGCSPATVSQSESAGAAGAPAYLLEGPAYDDEVVVEYTDVADSGMEAEVEVDVEFTAEEQHARAFGNTDWDCCWSSKCDEYRVLFCDDGEVITTDGLQRCCKEDIGQCPERFRPDVDADAGVE